jgi:hypothetical protein
MKRCENCVFFRSAPDHCRRYPPRPISMTDATFPLTHPKFSCGEFKLSILKLFFGKKHNPAASGGTA